MLEHDYTAKDIFNKNFFHDWRKEMTEEERAVIKDLKKCDFKEMHKYFTEVLITLRKVNKLYMTLVDTF